MSAAGAAAPLVTADSAIDAGKLERQNAYLKLRCAQLQDDVTNLESQVVRLQQELDRLRGRRAAGLESSRP
ncbi:MAG TPA: hypothetical protein VGG29_19275 [Caulobacteraceae bacterium]|jgi:hypothetical protein